VITDDKKTSAGTGIMSEMLPRLPSLERLYKEEGVALHPTLNNYIYVSVSFARLGIEPTTDASTGIAALRNYLVQNPISVLHGLATPIETPLSAEQLAAYAALHTNLPNTIINNDAGADMEVKYTSIGG
jgi:hypothetical protein